MITKFSKTESSDDSDDESCGTAIPQPSEESLLDQQLDDSFTQDELEIS